MWCGWKWYVLFFSQRLEFFCSLPCINYAFALKLLQNFPTLSEFVSRYVFLINLYCYNNFNVALPFNLFTNTYLHTTLSSRCSTVLKISSNLGVDINAAKRIFSVICEAHVWLGRPVAVCFTLAVTYKIQDNNNISTCF